MVLTSMNTQKLYENFKEELFQINRLWNFYQKEEEINI